MDSTIGGLFFPPYAIDINGSYCPYCCSNYRNESKLYITIHIKKCFAAKLKEREEWWLTKKQEQLFLDAKLRANKLPDYHSSAQVTLNTTLQVPDTD